MCSRIPVLSTFPLNTFIELFKHMKLTGKLDTELVYKSGNHIDGF